MSEPGARLRQLAEAATPGPWVACGDKRGGCQCGNVWSEPIDAPVARAIPEAELNEAGWSRNRKEQLYDDARLIALAPSLAVLCADMADALAHPAMHLQGAKHDAESCFTCSSLLARFRALTQEPT